ncbi:importin-like protein, putative [Theileria annulata]|uniref:Importin-like protein, putative n=1 Tax=Theileria annulata TaxID=5874 RepID=Q4UDM6_THEAN|nr:importin-like protein, putative [Theileria annulata]CAI74813.1 importin-like protein, putative [Theileria annulata]|eukprot:XP_952545.1 importin-like protein, putative [Theileria annulata]
MSSNLTDPLVLLDTSRPFDEAMVPLLDSVIISMFDGTNVENRETAHRILEQFKKLPDSWKHVALILSKSNNSNTKFYALQVLEICIETRWNILPDTEKAGIKQYVSELVIKLCMDEEVCRNERHFLTKVNECLIQVVKREWPDRWPNFISEICKASQVSQNICENNMRLLNMLSEEIFDFGEDSMQSKRVQKLVSRMTSEFREIFELCIFVLNSFISNPNMVNNTLVKQTLVCLSHFLKWIPYGYIFESYPHGEGSVVLLDLLLDHFWDPMQYRVECTKCLNEVASLTLTNNELQAFSHRIMSLWPKVVQKVSTLPPESFQYDNAKIPPSMLLFWETFYTQLTLFLTNLLKNFRETVLEKIPSNRDSLLFVLEKLVTITTINHEETFKIALDFWHYFSNQLLRELKEYERRNLPIRDTNDPNYMVINAINQIDLNTSPELMRLRLYKPILIQVQKVMINRMAKPQEVYIMYDADSGEVVREYNPNTAEIALYNKMKNTQIILTTMLQEDSENIMKAFLDKEMDQANVGGNEPWDPTTLNRLCYSVGSITGSMEEPVEKRFLVVVIKCLLNICEIKNEISSKAIVASNIMYVVGQYPSFLKTNWRFLNTVLNKLFEFMRETFPGVQQMACETFLKITNSCRKVIGSQSVDGRLYVDELISTVGNLETVLDDKLILYYYESVGNVISTLEQNLKIAKISSLMELSNNRLFQIYSKFLIGVSVEMVDNMEKFKSYIDRYGEDLFGVEVARTVIQILRINNRVCKAVGFAFTKQFNKIFNTLMVLYHLYSKYIQISVATGGTATIKHLAVNTLFLARRAIIHLSETYIVNVPNKLNQTNTQYTGLSSNVNRSRYRTQMDQNKTSTPVSSTSYNDNLEDSYCYFIEDKSENTNKMQEKKFNFFKFGPNGTQELTMDGCNQTDSTNDSSLDLGGQNGSWSDSEMIVTLLDNLVAVMMGDYRDSVFETRDYEILSLSTKIIERLASNYPSVLIQIFNYVFDTSLDMVKMDFHAYPDHREYFYEMLHKATKCSFDSVLLLPNERLRDFVMSLVWAFKHEHPSIADRGLLITLEFMKNIIAKGSVVLHQFCLTFYYLLLTEILGVLTDTLHKSGFRLQTQILKILIKIVANGLVDDPSKELTKLGVMRFLVDLLTRSFQSLNNKQIEAFVVDLFNYSVDSMQASPGSMSSGMGTTQFFESDYNYVNVYENPTISGVLNTTNVKEEKEKDKDIRFQTHVRDFLLSLKEFAGCTEEFQAIFEKDREEAIERARQLGYTNSNNIMYTKEVNLN